MNDVIDPDYWRHRAAAARTHAEQFADPRVKAQMLKVAEGYDWMAAMARQVNRLKGRRKKP